MLKGYIYVCVYYHCMINILLKIGKFNIYKYIKKNFYQGISNWRVDASKMNRAISLFRNDLEEEDII